MSTFAPSQAPTFASSIAPTLHEAETPTRQPAGRQSPGLQSAGRQPDGTRDSLELMLTETVRAGGSDLHLTVGRPPMLRLDGEIRALPGYRKLRARDTERLLRSVLDDAQWAQFESELELDVAYSLRDVARFRITAFRQRSSCGAVIHTVPHDVARLADLDLPEQVRAVADLSHGLVLVAGPAGSGVSTTLAALVDHANRTRRAHIVTVEDPIEFLHGHRRSVVNQRELGPDTHSLAEGLEHVLAQDPDVVVVSELRDPETVSAALAAAAADRLLLASVRADTAVAAIDHLVRMFPQDRRKDVRTRLSQSLGGVVAQALVHRTDGTGRVVVCEVALATPAVRARIAAGRTASVATLLRSGDDALLAFDTHLAQRVADGLISAEDGLALCRSPKDYRRLAGESGAP